MSIIQNQTRQFNQDTFGPAALNNRPLDTFTFNPLVAQPFLSTPPSHSNIQSQSKWDKDFKLYDVSWHQQGFNHPKVQAREQSSLNAWEKGQAKVPEGLKVAKVEKKQGKSVNRQKGKKRTIRKRKQEENCTQLKISMYFKTTKPTLTQLQK